MTAGGKQNPGPLMLLADSQLLLIPERGDALQCQLRQDAAVGDGFAVYVGAANGCEAAFYDMACDAMAMMGINRTLFLKRDLVELGDCAAQIPALILLSGGDPVLGWQVLGQNPVRDWLLRCHHAGSVLVGISAGALHLTSALTARGGRPARVPFLDLYPAVTLVHEEQSGWPGEAAYLGLDQDDHYGCFKIPLGSGVRIAGGGNESRQLQGFGRARPTLLRGREHQVL